MPTHKMDRKLVSSQKWELEYIAKKFKVPVKGVREAKKIVGTSRRAVYGLLAKQKRGKINLILFNDGEECGS